MLQVHINNQIIVYRDLKKQKLALVLENQHKLTVVVSKKETKNIKIRT